MIRQGMNPPLVGLLVLLAIQPNLRAETKDEAPDPKEVYDLVRAHLSGVTEAELNQAAVRGLISALGPRVSLLPSGEAAREHGEAALVSRASLFDGDIAYLRVGRVEEGLGKSVRGDYEKLAATNKLKGLVLDLRYAVGDDYAAAAATADLFVKKEQPLLNWGNGTVRSTEKKDTLLLPVAVLVNRQTAAAAEALAAALRQTGVGLILGGRTAGKAMVAQEHSP